jgi:arsenite-transporting ATPase
MDIDVEPVEDLEDIDDAAVPAGLDAAEYILYGGKGGVGKTTMAAATALASARDGTDTLVVSTDPAHSLSDTLDADIPDDPERIRDDIPLYAAEIDPEQVLSDDLFGEDDPLTNVLGQDAEDLLDEGMPGSDEAAAIRILLDFFDDPRFERVIVDTAPTGHTLRLLELPDTLDSMIGKVLSMRQRITNLMSGLGNMFGEDHDPEDSIDSLEEFADRIEDLRAVLRDPARTDFRVVMVPEEMSVLESERLLNQLEAYDIPVGTIVVNRVLQDPNEVADVDADWFISPNHQDCEFCNRRWEVQQRALERAQDIFRGHKVRRVPLFAEEVRGERLLRVVAACLAD